MESRIVSVQEKFCILLKIKTKKVAHGIVKETLELDERWKEFI